MPARAHWQGDFAEIQGRDRKLLERLLDAMSENLGLGTNYLNDYCGRSYGPDVLIMNRYPPCPQPELALGMSAHTDTSILTALLQDDVAGLEVKKDGSWVVLDPVPGAYVINIGDTLQVMINLSQTFRYKVLEHTCEFYVRLLQIQGPASVVHRQLLLDTVRVYSPGRS